MSSVRKVAPFYKDEYVMLSIYTRKMLLVEMPKRVFKETLFVYDNTTFPFPITRYVADAKFGLTACEYPTLSLTLANPRIATRVNGYMVNDKGEKMSFKTRDGYNFSSFIKKINESYLVDGNFCFLFEFKWSYEFYIGTRTDLDLAMPLMVRCINRVNKQLFDFWFQVGDKKIGSLKYLLRMYSEVFARMFDNEWRERDGIMYIEDFDFDTMTEFIEIIHCGRYTFDNDPIISYKVKALAHKYDAERIEKAIDVFAISYVNGTNFVDLFKLTQRYMDHDLQERLIEHLINNMNAQIEEIVDFDELDYDALRTLVTMMHKRLILQRRKLEKDPKITGIANV